MVVEINPSARIQVRGANELLHPATCAVCQNGVRDTYVDPALFYEYEGQVYFCSLCVTEMAEAIGCLEPQQAAWLQQVNNTLAARNTVLELVAKRYETLIGVLREHASNALTSGDIDNLSDLTGSSGKKEPAGDNLSNDQPTIPREGPSAVTPEPVKESGPPDFTRNAGSDERPSQSVPTFRI